MIKTLTSLIRESFPVCNPVEELLIATHRVTTAMSICIRKELEPSGKPVPVEGSLVPTQATGPLYPTALTAAQHDRVLGAQVNYPRVLN